MDVQETTRRVGEALGGHSRVVKFRDGERAENDAESAGGEADRDEVAVLVADECPGAGFASYSTLDMSRFPTNVRDADGRRIDSELITVGRASQRGFADVIAKCAFAAAGGSLHVTPLAILPDAVAAAEDGRTMRHVLLVPPFIWPDLPVVVEEEADDAGPARVTTWLQAVPISDAEFRFAAESGAEALFDTLESAGADVSDLDRDSVL